MMSNQLKAPSLYFYKILLIYPYFYPYFIKKGARVIGGGTMVSGRTGVPKIRGLSRAVIYYNKWIF